MLRLMTFLTALMMASAAAASTAWINAPRDGYLNLRTGPSTGYQIIEHMTHGTRVEVLRRPGKWVKLRSGSGRIGWAHSGWLTDTRPGKPRSHTAPQHGASKGTYYVDAPRHSGLNLRSGPGTGYTIARTMGHGDRVEVLGTKGKWWLLRHSSGAVGYAHSGYLSKKRPNCAQPHRGQSWGHSPKPRQPYGGPRHQPHGPRAGYRPAPNLAELVLRCSGREGAAFNRCVARGLAHSNR